MADALIVGGRCAGATLATFLARAGKRAIVVERADMPSDQPMSTHFISPYGMTILDEIDVGAAVRAIAPPVPRFMNGIEDDVACIEFPEGRRGSCPRRVDLDMILVEAARKAGADVRLRTKLVELVRDGDRVVGGIVEHDGTREEIRADIVVGADGQHSKVAELVAAEEYRGYETPRGAYWGYWPRPSWYSDHERYRGAAMIIHYGDEYWIIFPTNSDQLLLAVTFPIEDLPRWRGHHRDTYEERMRTHPLTAPLTKDAAPLGKVVGLVSGRFYFRRAAGPGWALVGDSGLFKDPAPGLGITDAFRDAKALAAAIATGGDAALLRYWRERDVASLELFEFARDMGTPGYNNPLNRAVFRLLAARPDLRDRVIDVQERTLSPFALLSLRDVVGVTLREVLRGRVDVLGPFLAASKRNITTLKELKEWRQRVTDVPARIDFDGIGMRP